MDMRKIFFFNKSCEALEQVAQKAGGCLISSSLVTFKRRLTGAPSTWSDCYCPCSQQRSGTRCSSSPFQLKWSYKIFLFSQFSVEAYSLYHKNHCRFPEAWHCYHKDVVHCHWEAAVNVVLWTGNFASTAQGKSCCVTTYISIYHISGIYISALSDNKQLQSFLTCDNRKWENIYLMKNVLQIIEILIYYDLRQRSVRNWKGAKSAK